MPRVSIWMVRSALVALVVGFSIGAIMLIGKGIGAFGGLSAGIPIHVELVVLGWMVQLAMGVALWILPRFGARGPGRGAAWSWVAWALWNGGIVFVVAGAGGAPVVQLIGRLIELGAAIAFGAAVWSRVRASGISAM